MHVVQYVPKKWRAAAGAALFSLAVQTLMPVAAMAQPDNSNNTRTPIKHVIVIIGENRTFDHVFATYKPKNGETVKNLLSEGIVNADGTPGPNFFVATQWSAKDTHQEGWQLSPGGKTLYEKLPPAMVGGPTTPLFSSVAQAKAIENGLANGYYKYLTTGGTGQTTKGPDTRIPNASNLPPGPFQLTSSTLPYDAYTASPVHRFYQMWQQMDCNAAYATTWNPSGCRADLFPWVETTIGNGSSGLPQPSGFNDQSTGEGSTAMAFYNVQNGDAPYLKFLADHYAMSDNYHQGVNGGTGANHVMLGAADAIWFSDGNGNPAVPPHNQLVAAGSKNAGVVDEIENPNAQPGTNNWYVQDGYRGSFGSMSRGGGTYSNCSDSNAPGVSSILQYLSDLPYHVDPKCAPGHYYLLNNYAPGYYGDGRNAYADITNPNQTVFTIPPSNLRTIGDAMLQKNISWAYYGDQWNAYLANPDLNYVAPNNTYCNICNPFQYVSSIMTNAAVRTAHLKDTTDLYAAIKNGTLPAVSYVKPDGYLDGHPASSKLNLFEGFVEKIVHGVQSNPELWNSTAIFVTFDEGGGYYDSGYIQPVDFFGDGTRVPMIVVSPYTKAGHISHEYTDHASVVKFIEANWGLKPLTDRSRDNLPNPKPENGNPYVPKNKPAIGDLMDLFTSPATTSQSRRDEVEPGGHCAGLLRAYRCD